MTIYHAPQRDMRFVLHELPECENLAQLPGSKEALRERDARMAAIVEHAIDGIVTIDEAGPVKADATWEIHRSAPSYEDQAATNELLETGIKVIDLMCPFKKGGKVAITGFGACEAIERGARRVRNPRTGETKRAKKTVVPKCRAGAELKAVVSGAKKLPKLVAYQEKRIDAMSHRPAATSTTASTARTSSTATEVSVSWNGVVWPNIDTSPASGMIANDTKHIVAVMSGASVKTKASAALGRTSSLSTDFIPPARVWSGPQGPLRFGPGRCCMRPMTRRSNQMTSRVEMSR